MKWNHIVISTIYEFKINYRSVLFRIFIFLATLGAAVSLFTGHTFGWDSVFRFSPDWISQVLPSSIAYKGAYYFNILQLLFATSFVSNDLRRPKLNAMIPLDSRPQSNMEIVFGSFLGKLLLFTLTNVLALIISVIINYTFLPQSFHPGIYIFYWLTLNLPALIFFLGISYLISRFIWQQALSQLISLAILITLVYWENKASYGLLDPMAHTLPNMFSDFTGHVNTVNYFLQRIFILLAGLTFLTASIIPYRRLPNHQDVLKKAGSIACLLLLGAGGIAFTYISRHQSIDDKRETYKQMYETYTSLPFIKIIQNNLHVQETQEGGISVESQMLVENDATITIPLVFFLNPGLKVTSVEIENTPTDFQQKSQVILTRQKLSPAGCVKVVIRYQGKIDNSICFLYHDAGSQNSTTVNNHGIYHFGYVPAFCERSYKLLTPECIWYPVCEPPQTPQGIQTTNFTRYSLRVEHDVHLKAISQGKRIEKQENETLFTFDHNMPGISLCVGNYDIRETIIDSTRIALYYLPSHNYLLKDYDLLSKEEICSSLEHIKRVDLETMECIRTQETIKRYYRDQPIDDPSQRYPYRWFSLIEVPCHFYSFTNLSQLTGERVRDGLVLAPEKGFSIQNYPVDMPEEQGGVNHPTIYKLEKEIQNIIQNNNSCNIKKQFIGHTAFISSPEYPIIHDVLAQVAQEKFNNSSSSNFIFADGTNPDYYVIKYLNNHSLKNAIQDRTLSAELRNHIIYKKSEELHAHITRNMGNEAFRRFYLDFLSGHLFQTTTLDEFTRQFNQTFNFRLDSLLHDWYTIDRLPLFEIQDAKIIVQTNDNEDELGSYHFKVFNRSNIPGLIVTNEGTRKIWNIPPREALEINDQIQSDLGYIFSLKIPLAQNIPMTQDLPRIDIRTGYHGMTTGSIPLDTSLFNKHEEGIIIDNEDPGFKITRNKSIITSLFQQEIPDTKYYKYSPNDTWIHSIQEHFYGFPIQSAMHKYSGEGKQKVEWNAVLPQEGRYEVFFYYTELFPKTAFTLSQTTENTRYYTIVSRDGSHDVTATLTKEEEGNWISLGIFDFDKDAKVILSDKASKKNTSPQTVIADAVKWVKRH